MHFFYANTSEYRKSLMRCMIQELTDMVTYISHMNVILEKLFPCCTEIDLIVYLGQCDLYSWSNNLALYLEDSYG